MTDEQVKGEVAKIINTLIEQARQEERKKIGRELHEIYDSQPHSFRLIREAIERLERGELLGRG